MPVFTPVRLKEAIRALANGRRRDAGHEIGLGGALGGTGRDRFFLCHTILHRYGWCEADELRMNTPRRRCSRKPASTRFCSNARHTCLSRPAIIAASTVVSVTP